ncbi:MAG: hypothetical protein GQ582_11820 [Methyloprofundus sp.]|nr:hypothetical protein [Methyloprofundus sp.]
MLELIEILRVANQGMTKPLICHASDGGTYYAKGKRATVDGLIKEWMLGNLAQTLGLPIPTFKIAYIDAQLVEHSPDAQDSLGEGYVFVSEQLPAATEFKYAMLKKIPLELQQKILLFDLWIENSDRTLSKKFSGNPNLLWQSETNKVFVIDHNLALEKNFDLESFWETHVFQSQFCNFQLDLVVKQEWEVKLQQSLEHYSDWWKAMPDEWKQENEELGLLNFDTSLQRLQQEAQGEIWSKIPKRIVA